MSIKYYTVGAIVVRIWLFSCVYVYYVGIIINTTLQLTVRVCASTFYPFAIGVVLSRHWYG